MTKDEALKLALEACEHCKDAIIERGLDGNPAFAEKWGLKLPIDAAHEAITAIKEVLAQPEQEPVAWSDEQLKMLNFLYGAGDFDGVWFEEKHPTERGAFWWREHLRRLFDTPLQRKPLTDEQCRADFEHWYSSAPEETEGPEHIYELTDKGMSEMVKENLWLGWQAAHGIKGE